MTDGHLALLVVAVLLLAVVVAFRVTMQRFEIYDSGADSKGLCDTCGSRGFLRDGTCFACWERR